MNYGIPASPFQATVRRKVFVSYHHAGDQQFYNEFSSFFHDGLETITDNSLERKIDSADVDYVMRSIREKYLTGSSCTIVLCGAQTPDRKYVDWEIMASLHQEMGLVGIGLPTIVVHPNGGTSKSPRLQDNIDSGYAEWALWSDIITNPGRLAICIERANSKNKQLIVNSRSRMQRNT